MRPLPNWHWLSDPKVEAYNTYCALQYKLQKLVEPSHVDYGDFNRILNGLGRFLVSQYRVDQVYDILEHIEDYELPEELFNKTMDRSITHWYSSGQEAYQYFSRVWNEAMFYYKLVKNDNQKAGTPYIG